MNRRDFLKCSAMAGALPLFNIGCAGFGFSRQRQIADGAKIRVAKTCKAAGYHDGINRISFKAPDDRYAGQLKELARIIRGEIPNPPGLYKHDLLVHKVSLDACNLKTEEVK